MSSMPSLVLTSVSNVMFESRCDFFAPDFSDYSMSVSRHLNASVNEFSASITRAGSSSSAEWTADFTTFCCFWKHPALIPTYSLSPNRYIYLIYIDYLLDRSSRALSLKGSLLQLDRKPNWFGSGCEAFAESSIFELIEIFISQDRWP